MKCPSSNSFFFKLLCHCQKSGESEGKGLNGLSPAKSDRNPLDICLEIIISTLMS